MSLPGKGDIGVERTGEKVETSTVDTSPPPRVPFPVSGNEKETVREGRRDGTFQNTHTHHSDLFDQDELVYKKIYQRQNEDLTLVT